MKIAGWGFGLLWLGFVSVFFFFCFFAGAQQLFPDIKMNERQI